MSEDKQLKPTSKFVGLAHEFLPFGKAGFATEISYFSDGYAEAKVEGMKPEDRAALRQKLSLEV